MPSLQKKTIPPSQTLLLVLCLIFVVSKFSTSRQKSCDVPFEPTTCLAVTVYQYERAGNNIVQLLTLQYLLAECTGIAVLNFALGPDDVLWVPETFSNTGCHNPLSKKAILDNCSPVILGRELHHTEELPKKLKETRCYKLKLKELGFFPPVRQRPPEQFVHVLDKLFLPHESVRRMDLTDTAVVHLRGGDIFKAFNPKSQWYAQPPCSYYLQSIEHSNASRTVIVTDDGTNPCVKYLINHLHDVRVIKGGGARRAFGILRSAPILIPTRSTFSEAAVSLSLVEARRVYVARDTSGAYGVSVPRHGYPKNTSVCVVEFDGKGTLPWTASKRQLQFMVRAPARVRRCIVTK